MNIKSVAEGAKACGGASLARGFLLLRHDGGTARQR